MVFLAKGDQNRYQEEDRFPASTLRDFPHLAFADTLSQNEVYITANFDENSLDTIVGRATILSPQAFQARYPSGKVPSKAHEFGKVFVCRRGCNTRTATYTQEFVWEDIFHGAEDLEAVRERVENETKATRKRKAATAARQKDSDYAMAAEDEDGVAPNTPRKKRKLNEARTPMSKSQAGTPRKFTTPGQRRYTIKDLKTYPKIANSTTESLPRSHSNLHL